MGTYLAILVFIIATNVELISLMLFIATTAHEQKLLISKLLNVLPL